MRKPFPLLTLTALAALILAGPSTTAAAQEFSSDQEQAIREVVRDYLLENPEIIMESIQILRQRQEEAAQAQAQATLTQNGAALRDDPNSVVGGNPDGDVTIVEFFDYRCGYCKRVHPTITDFIASDGNIRFVYKEWPILGPDSVFAARAALASREQDRYIEFQDLLMSERDVNRESVQRIAEQIGMDWAKLEADMDSPIVTAHIESTMQLAQALGINGTPAFVIGDEVIPGAVDANTLEAIVRDIREGS
jgi:protein-disulfide isomerase